VFLKGFGFFKRSFNFFKIPHLFTLFAVLSYLFTVEDVINSLNLDLILRCLNSVGFNQ